MRGKVIMAMILLAGVALNVAASGYQVTVTIGATDDGTLWWPYYYPNGLRLQYLIDQSRIDYAGTINEFELRKTSLDSGAFYNTTFYLCYTNVSALTTNFANNYGGHTPVNVGSYSLYTIPAVNNYYPIPMTSTFSYDNAHNLILEIVYTSGSGSQCRVGNGFVSNHRLSAGNYAATTGTLDSIAYNCRISFSYFSAQTPASLGRIKAVYR